MCLVSFNYYMKDYSQAFINTNGEEFPNTKAVDAGSPGNTNGTEIIADLLNDNWGFSQALLKAASISPNGKDESADNSQKLEAIKKLYNDADTALKNILTQTITQENTALQNNINTEKTQRTQADTTLQNNINTEKARITKEITYRTNADTNLQNQINTAKYNLSSNGTEVKMPYTIDGKAVYKRFWSKSFTNNQIISSLPDLNISTPENILSIKYLAVSTYDGIITCNDYKYGDGPYAFISFFKDIKVNIKDPIVMICNVDIEYIKG